MGLRKRSLILQRKNTPSFNEKKVIEELSELLLVIIQKETKKHTSNPIDDQEIIDEIGDAKRMIWYLEKKYGKNKVKERIKNKVTKLEKKYNVSSRRSSNATN